MSYAKEVINKLSNEEHKRILMLYFGIDTKAHTLKECADELGISLPEAKELLDDAMKVLSLL